MEGVPHEEFIEIGNKSLEVKKNKTSEESTDLVQKIMKHKKNNDKKDAKIIVDLNQPALETVATLAKLIQIEETTVLIKLAGFAGFGETDEKVMENLCLTLRELFHCWEKDPDVVEKLFADKMEAKIK